MRPRTRGPLPEADAGALPAGEWVGIDGVEYTTAPTGTYEHVDLIFNNGGPFDPATYGGDAAKAQAAKDRAKAEGHNAEAHAEFHEGKQEARDGDGH